MTVSDTTARVVTPEKIALDYQLSGPFRRLPAYLIDLIVRGVLLVLAFLLMLLVGASTSIFSGGTYAVAAFTIGNFLLSFFYGAFCESTFNGRTAGKAICGLRVIGIDGRPISGSSAMIRNLLRPADMMPMAPILILSDEMWVPTYLIPTGVVALVVMTMTSRMQRLGDLAAGTMVVVDERTSRLPLVTLGEPRAVALAEQIPGNYRVSISMAKMLAVYIERRRYLSPPRRREIAAQLTEPLVRRLELGDEIDPDLLMMAFYHQTFLAGTELPAESSVEVPAVAPEEVAA